MPEPPFTTTSTPPSGRRIPWGTLLRVGLTLGVLLLVVDAARDVPWDQVRTALLDTSPAHLAGAVLLALLAYVLYGSYDHVGRRMAQVRARPTLRELAPMAATSFALNQNLGYLIGGLALRYRLYRSTGLSRQATGVLMGNSIATQWLGHFLLAGLLIGLLPRTLPWPADLVVSPGQARAAAVLLGLLALAYLAACQLSSQRELHIGQHTLRLPRGPQALLQAGLSTMHWLCTSAALWWLLPDTADFVEVAVVVLLASVAGALAHVPAGLGVLEMVFTGMLGARLGVPTVLAALVVYRAAFQWLPGLAALLVYLQRDRQDAPAPAQAA